jgi:hypothetical protein
MWQVQLVRSTVSPGSCSPGLEWAFTLFPVAELCAGGWEFPLVLWKVGLWDLSTQKSGGEKEREIGEGGRERGEERERERERKEVVEEGREKEWEKRKNKFDD